MLATQEERWIWQRRDPSLINFPLAFHIFAKEHAPRMRKSLTVAHHLHGACNALYLPLGSCVD